MATIADYLLELDRQRDQLAANLTAMGSAIYRRGKAKYTCAKGIHANSYRRRIDDENGTIRCK